jgi:predicted alpha/beta superfamily hydrolase
LDDVLHSQQRLNFVLDMDSRFKVSMTLSCMMFLFSTFAQPTIKIQVNKKESSGVINEPLYVAGSFNEWQPSNPKYRLQQDSAGNWFIKLSAPKNDVLEFKFTRGSWDKVETQPDGSDIPNHAIKVQRDTALNYTIQSWKDQHIPQPRLHTATSQVQVIDTAFYLKALGVHRRLWLYLPKDYATSGKRYPVLYMQDGQNIFDAYTASFGEWAADEILDSVSSQTGKNCIIVAIDHGGVSRMTDYNPYNMPRFGKGNGKLYVKSLVQSVKPFIDQHYRTKADAANTWIAGSSMGGLISLWAVMQYPKIFGGAGILSPSLWIAPPIKKDAGTLLKRYKGKLFFYAGGMESQNMIADMDTVINKISQNSKAIITRRIEQNAGHNEAAWKHIMPEFVKEMFSIGQP